jgi:hypothetical protein
MLDEITNSLRAQADGQLLDWTESQEFPVIPLRQLTVLNSTVTALPDSVPDERTCDWLLSQEFPVRRITYCGSFRYRVGVPRSEVLTEPILALHR